MKIVHYAYDDTNNPYCGGGGAFRELTIHRMLSARHAIRYYTGNFTGAKNHSENGISFVHLGVKRNYLLSRISFSIAATIHSLFVHADIIVIGYSVFSPVLTFLFRRKKTIIEFYHLTNLEPFKKYSIFGIFPWVAERVALVFGTNFITLTDSMSETIRSKFPRKNVCTAYTGFDESIGENIANNVSDGKYILNFGRIDIHMKGLDILVGAFEAISASFPEHKLVIAGRGSKTDINWLRKRIGESPVGNRIVFKENVSKEDKYRLFHEATFVCMPSRFEGWCICAIEAAACAKASLGTDIMGLRDSIRENQTGLLAPPDSIDALAEKMKLLLSDEKLRTTLGVGGTAWADNFKLERIVSLQEHFYANVAAGVRTA